MFASLFASRSHKKTRQLRCANNRPKRSVIGGNRKHNNLPQKSDFFTFVSSTTRIFQVQHSTPNIEEVPRLEVLGRSMLNVFWGS
jgi:hypothetical protein